jgi:hypothetical protein
MKALAADLTICSELDHGRFGAPSFSSDMESIAIFALSFIIGFLIFQYRRC